jgi:hypothetical protein
VKGITNSAPCAPPTSLGGSSSNKVPSSDESERARVIFTPSCGFKHRCDSAVTRLALIRVGEFQRAITPEEEYLDNRVRGKKKIHVSIIKRICLEFYSPPLFVSFPFPFLIIPR